MAWVVKSPRGSVIETLRRLSTASLIDLMFFGAMLDQSVVSRLKVLYLERNSERRTKLCVTKIQASAQVYLLVTLRTPCIFFA